MSIEKTIEANSEAMLALAAAMTRVAEALEAGSEGPAAAPDAGDKKPATRKKTAAKTKAAEADDKSNDEGSETDDYTALREKAAGLLVRVAKEKSRKTAETLLSDTQKGAKNLKAVADENLAVFVAYAEKALGDEPDDLLG